MRCAAGDRALERISYVPFFTALFSSAHWLDARPGWRKVVDETMAHLAFFIMVPSGFLVMRGFQSVAIGIVISVALVGAFEKSKQGFRDMIAARAKTDHWAWWIKWHMTFHFIVGFGFCWWFYNVTTNVANIDRTYL